MNIYVYISWKEYSYHYNFMYLYISTLRQVLKTFARHFEGWISTFRLLYKHRLSYLYLRVIRLGTFIVTFYQLDTAPLQYWRI